MPFSDLRRRGHLKTMALIVAVIFIVGTILAYLSMAPGRSADPEVAVVVNGEQILTEEIVELLKQRHGQEVLDELIQTTVIRQQARHLGISVSSERMAEEMERVREQFGSDAEFQSALSQYGLTEPGLRNIIEIDILVEKMVVEIFDISITEEEAEEYFLENKDNFSQPERLDLRHILVDTEEEAIELLDKLSDGADFSDLAREYSTDPGSGPDGGLIKNVVRGQMVPEFEEAAFSLIVGQISDPVETMYGYHIITVDTFYPAVIADWEDIKDDVRRRLIGQQAQDHIWEYIQQLRNEASIDYRVNW